MIGKVQQILKSEFPEDWFSEFKQGSKGLEKELDEATSLSRERILDLFCISLFSGEYIRNKSFLNQLNDVESFIDSYFDIYPDKEEEQKVIYKKVKQGLVDVLKVYIRIYKNFHTLLDSHTRFPEFDIVFYSNPSLKNFLPRKTDKEVSANVNFFYRIINLQRLDHFFQDDFSFYQDLLSLEDSFDDKSLVSKYKVVAKEKIQYLKYKWEIRQKTFFLKNDIFTPIKSYIIDDELRIVAQSPKNHSNNSKLKEWQKYLECHYELTSNWRLEIQTRVNSFIDGTLSESSLTDLHSLIKYHKDITHSYPQLEEITQEIEERLESADIWNRHSFQKALIYSLNNLFSLLIKSKNPDIAKIETLKEQIGDYQKRFRIENFFTDYKYLQFTISQLEKDLGNRAELDRDNNLRENIDKVENIFKEYRKKVRWTKEHYNLLFTLPVEDCLVPSNIPELPEVYYPSAFSLPLPHSHVQDNFDKLYTRFEKLTISYSSIENLGKEFSVIKEMKGEMKKNDFKSLEVMGIFTAIITFVMATVPSIQFITSFEQAIYFTFSISSSFFIFIFGLLSLTRGITTLKKNIIFFLAVGLILGFCGYLYLQSENEKSTQKVEVSAVQIII